MLHPVHSRQDMSSFNYTWQCMTWLWWGLDFNPYTYPIFTEKAVKILPESPYPQNRLIGSGRPKPSAIQKVKLGHVT